MQVEEDQGKVKRRATSQPPRGKRMGGLHYMRLQNYERGQQKMAMSKEPGHLKLVLIH